MAVALDQEVGARSVAKQSQSFAVKILDLNKEHYIEMNDYSLGSSDFLWTLLNGNAPVSDRLKRLDNPELSLQQKMELLQRELTRYGIKLDNSEAANWLIYFMSLSKHYGVSLSQIASNFVSYINENRNKLMIQLQKLELGVFGRLESFLDKAGSVKLGDLTHLQISGDQTKGFYLHFDNRNIYITEKGLLIYRDRDGKIKVEEVKDKSKLGERYEQLKRTGVQDIFYVYSGDLQKGEEVKKGIRVERLLLTPEGPVVYHGKIVGQVIDVKIGDQHKRLEVLIVRTTEGVRAYYRAADPSDRYFDRYKPDWMPLDQSTLNNPNSIFRRARDVAGNSLKVIEIQKGVFAIDGAEVFNLESNQHGVPLPQRPVFFMNYMPMPVQEPKQPVPGQPPQTPSTSPRTDNNLVPVQPTTGENNQQTVPRNQTSTRTTGDDSRRDYILGEKDRTGIEPKGGTDGDKKQQPRRIITPDEGVNPNETLTVNQQQTPRVGIQPKREKQQSRKFEYEPVQIPKIPEPQTNQIPEYKIRVRSPEVVFLNSTPTSNTKDGKFVVEVEMNSELLRDMREIVLRIGTSVLKIPRDQVQVDENGNIKIELPTEFVGYNIGVQTVKVEVYGEGGRLLMVGSSTTKFIIDRASITSPRSLQLPEGESRKIPVTASYSLLPTVGAEITDQKLGVVGISEGEDGRWYLLFAAGTKVNGKDVSEPLVFNTREEAEEFIKRNEIVTETQRIERGRISFNLNFGVPPGVKLNNIEFRMVGSVNVDGIQREIDVKSNTVLKYLPRPEPITGIGTDESTFEKPKEEQSQKEKEESKQQSTTTEIQLALETPGAIVRGSQESVPVAVKVSNASAARAFAVDKEGNIVLPNGKVIGKIKDFVDEVSGLFDLEKLYAELSKYRESKVPDDGQVLFRNPGEGFTVYALARNDQGEMKLVQQEIGSVEVSGRVSVQDGVIRDGKVEKSVEFTVKVEPPNVTGFDPLKQVNIDGKSLEELQRQGLVSVEYNPNTKEVKIVLTDRGMKELGMDGKVEVGLNSKVGVQDAHGSVVLDIKRDATVAVAQTPVQAPQVTIEAPLIHKIVHKNFAPDHRFTADQGMPTKIPIRITTDQLKDVNGDGKIDVQDVREMIRNGTIALVLRIGNVDIKLRPEMIDEISLEQKEDGKYVIGIDVTNFAILALVKMSGKLNLRAAELICEYKTQSETHRSSTLIQFINNITSDMKIPDYREITISRTGETTELVPPGERDVRVFGFEGQANVFRDIMANISRAVADFRAGKIDGVTLSKRVLEQFNRLRIYNPGQEGNKLTELMGDLPYIELRELVQLAGKQINEMTDEEVRKLAAFAIALDLEALEFNSAFPTDVNSLRSNPYVLTAHKVLIVLFGNDQMSDDDRRKLLEDIVKRSPYNATKAYSVYKALIGKYHIQQEERVVVETEFFRLTIERQLWEMLTPEQKLLLFASLTISASSFTGTNVFGVGIKTKAELVLEYENDRFRIKVVGGVESRNVFGIFDPDKLLKDMNSLGLYGRIQGNIYLVKNRDGSVEIVFGGGASLENILGERPQEVIVVSHIGVVTRYMYHEENGEGYYKIEAKVKGNMTLAKGTVHLTGAQLEIRMNINPRVYVSLFGDVSRDLSLSRIGGAIGFRYENMDISAWWSTDQNGKISFGMTIRF